MMIQSVSPLNQTETEPEVVPDAPPAQEPEPQAPPVEEPPVEPSQPDWGDDLPLEPEPTPIQPTPTQPDRDCPKPELCRSFDFLSDLKLPERMILVSAPEQN